MSDIQFTKMHGLGNDFVVIDGVNQTIHLTPDRIRQLADRYRGIGFDQLLLLEASDDYDFTYRIFNADGGEVAQCGNGARCAARFAHAKGLTDKQQLQFETRNGVVDVQMLENNLVKAGLAIPDVQANQTIDGVAFGIVSLGNPHAVTLVDDIDTAPVTTFGPRVENDALFVDRTNVGFMQIIDSSHIKLRVWERGVGETQACGSGACAAVVIGRLQHQLAETVTVQLKGGELQIQWQGDSNLVNVIGLAEFVFDGVIRHSVA